MASIRIVHSAAPEDAPLTDLHIWTPPEVESGGFTTPAPISDALAEFMGLPSGSSASHSEIIRTVIHYTKTHGLLERAKIRADTKLTELLGLEPTTELTILNLATFIRPHITPLNAAAFNAWWAERDQPLWIGIHLDLKHAKYIWQYESVYRLFQRDAYTGLKVVVYTGEMRTDEVYGPCGCGDYTPCDYHRNGEESVACCGCSEEHKIVCPYHADFD